MKLVLDRFETPLPKAASDRVYYCIIDTIEARDPGLSEVASAARAMVASPSVENLKHLLSFSALDFLTRNEVYGCFQLQALFKKRGDLELGVDTAKQALDTFLLSERLCRETNRKLRDRTDPDFGRRAALIFKMQRKISNLLGPLPSLDDVPFGFGTGSNVGCSKNTSVRMKLSAVATSTVGVVPYFKDLTFNVQTWPGLERGKIVCGSRFATVPKTSLTDRAINVEPIVNTYLQKGYGLVIRERLLRVGVNTKDQTKNQRLALIGSRDGRLATIDLSMASDLIAYLLVLDLLPFEWFEALEACRCPMTQLPDGKWVILEKFSSMGNGYTFELETMIFWALLASVCPDGSVISAYGDDLICPSECFDEVIDALKLLGFVPNQEKSFGAGAFRESCGKDYWGGFEVRPVFVKERMSAKELFRLHNFFYRTMEYDALPDLLTAFIPRHLKCYGPEGFGDGHLLTSSLSLSYDKRGWDGAWASFKTWEAIPRTVIQDTPGDFGAILYLTERAKADEALVSSTYKVERSQNPRYRRRTKRLRVVNYSLQS